MKSNSHIAFFRNTAWQYGLQLLKYLFPLVLIPYLTRTLKTDAYAVYAYVYSFMGFMQVIADFGFTLSGTRKVVEMGKDNNQLDQLVGNIFGARMVLIAMLLIATLIISGFIPLMASNLWYVVLAFTAVSFRSLLPDYVFQGFENMRPLTTRYLAAKGIQLILILLFVRSPEDLLLVAIADIAGSMIGFVWSYISIWHMFSVRISFPSLRGSLVELRDSSIYCISNISSSLLSGFTTIVVGLALQNNEEIAFWSLALITINAVQSLYNPIINSLYPHMLNNQDFRFAKKLALLAMPVLALGTLSYCLLADSIALILGGQEYLGASSVMVMLAPVLPFSFYAMLLGWPVLGALGHEKNLTLTTVSVGIGNMILLTILYLFGVATLENLCLVRWAADAVLLCLRLFMLVKLYRFEWIQRLHH